MRSTCFVVSNVLLTFLSTGALVAQNTPPLDSLFGKLVTSSQRNSAWNEDQLKEMQKVRDAALADSYAYDQLAWLSDNIGARPIGSPALKVSVDYVAQQLRDLGATVTLEKSMLPHWVRGEEKAALISWPGNTSDLTQKIAVTALAPSAATPDDGLVAPIIVINSFDELQAQPAGSLKGKIVLFNRVFDERLVQAGHALDAYGQAVIYRVVGPSTASRLGASAVLVRSVTGNSPRLPHTGETFFEKDVKPVPVGAVSTEDADLIAHLARQGSVSMRLTLTPRTLPLAEGYNIIADWKGSEHPEQVVLVSGHLDSWDLGTGATDNGPGIVIGMETIELMHALNLHPRRTIRFVAWADEEVGASSAQTYLQDYASEIPNHIAAIENDRGADHPFGILFHGPKELGSYLAPVAHTLDPIGASLVLNEEEIGEDVAVLIQKGVPGICSAQDLRRYFDYHHSAADTLDKVDPHQLAENAAVTAVLAFALADAEKPAPRSH